MKRKYDVVFPFFATLIFILTLSVTVLAQSAQSTAPTADSFGVGDASGQSGTYVEVPVNIANVRNGPVQSIRIRVDYNESVLSLTSISEGDLTLNWTHLQLGEDRHTMTIATSYTGDAILDGSNGSVVLLNFHVLGSPSNKSPMNLSLIELSNPDGEVGTAPARNGTFTIKPSAGPTPTPTSSPGGGGGGGGGGGYVPTTPTPAEKPPVVAKVVKIISRIEAGKPESVTFEGLDVCKISIEADKNVNDVNVIVEELEKPLVIQVKTVL